MLFYSLLNVTLKKNELIEILYGQMSIVDFLLDVLWFYLSFADCLSNVTITDVFCYPFCMMACRQ